MKAEVRDITSRAICRERCAFMGEPPCWEVGAWPNEECDEPGCIALADAALAAVAPLIAAAERERIADNMDARARLSSDPNAIVMYRDAAAAIRALGDAPDE